MGAELPLRRPESRDRVRLDFISVELLLRRLQSLDHVVAPS
jgi:hypothetical protein